MMAAHCHASRAARVPGAVSGLAARAEDSAASHLHQGLPVDAHRRHAAPRELARGLELAELGKLDGGAARER